MSAPDSLAHEHANRHGRRVMVPVPARLGLLSRVQVCCTPAGVSANQDTNVGFLAAVLDSDQLYASPLSPVLPQDHAPNR
jgi:hypothetical protein